MSYTQNKGGVEGLTLEEAQAQKVASAVPTKYNNSVMKSVLTESVDLNTMFDGMTFKMRSTSSGHPKPWVKYYNTGQRDTGWSFGWSGDPAEAEEFLLRKRADGHLGLTPKKDPNTYFAVDTCCGVGESRYVTIANGANLDITKLAVEYATNELENSAGNMHVRYADHHQRNLDSRTAYPYGTLASNSRKGWFSFYVVDAGEALTHEYMKKAIPLDTQLQVRCCNRDYDGELTEETCIASGYLQQLGRCDATMTTFCADPANVDDPRCSCINSPLKSSGIPVGCDVSCQRGGNSYLRNSELLATQAGCKYIDCTQNISLTPEQRDRISNVNIEQNCSIDGSGAGDSGVGGSDSNSDTDTDTDQLADVFSNIGIVLIIVGFLLLLVGVIMIVQSRSTHIPDLRSLIPPTVIAA
jgi:hypothetical protein